MFHSDGAGYKTFGLDIATANQQITRNWQSAGKPTPRGESTELARDRTTQTAGALLDNDGGERDVRMYKT